jgi:hypothetical protein
MASGHMTTGRNLSLEDHRLLAHEPSKDRAAYVRRARAAVEHAIGHGGSEGALVRPNEVTPTRRVYLVLAEAPARPDWHADLRRSPDQLSVERGNVGRLSAGHEAVIDVAS